MNRSDYFKTLTEQIRCRRARPMIEEELQAHIDDQKLDFMAQGLSEKEAEEAAVNEMGDPVEVGVALDRIHRPRMDRKLLAMIAFLGIMGLGIQMVAGRIASLCGYSYFQAAERRSLLWTIVGIVVMMGICYVDYSLFGKYTRSIWVVLMAIMAGYSIWGPMINGTYPRAGMFWCMLAVVYAGFLFYYRGKGKKGLMKCILILAISLILFWRLLNGSIYAGFFYLTAVVLLLCAIHRAWFGKEKKRLFLGTIGATVVLPAGILGILMNVGHVVAAYQKDRLKLFFQFQASDGFLYQMVQHTLANAVQALSGREGVIIDQTTDQVWNEIKSDYIWLFIFKVFGTWKGIFFTLAVVGFLGALFWIVRRQKNQLGYFMGMSCVLMMTFETFAYFGTNAGILLPFSVYMPFFSYGGSNILSTYFYMGILMSITRNQYVVKADNGRRERHFLVGKLENMK